MTNGDICWRVDVSGDGSPREGYLLLYAQSKYAAMRRLAERGLHIVGATQANGADVWPGNPELAARFDRAVAGELRIVV